jgi:hypothetical protein
VTGNDAEKFFVEVSDQMLIAAAAMH